MKFTYTHDKGTLVLAPVTAVMDVKNVSFKTAEPHDCFITIEQAEQVAVITDNRNIQVCFGNMGKSIYVFQHTSPQTGYICRIESLNFNTKSETAQQYIERMRQYKSHSHINIAV